MMEGVKSTSGRRTESLHCPFMSALLSLLEHELANNPNV